MEWETVRHEFEPDGSLRDLYVVDTSAREWDRFLADLPSWGYPARFSLDGVPAPLPSRFEDVRTAQARRSALLQIDVGGLGIACHFFTLEEIELDLDAGEMTDPTRLDPLVEFMRRLGAATGRPVLLTPENARASPILRYSPATNRVTHEVAPTTKLNPPGSS
jgi:hypothetical protein